MPIHIKVPRSLPLNLLLIGALTYCYWAYLYFHHLSMDFYFVVFPFGVTVVVGYYALQSYYRGNADYGFHLLFIFIVLGYIINTGLIDINRDNHIWGTWRSIGRFDFSNYQYLNFWLVVCAGASGFFCGFKVSSQISVFTFRKYSLYSTFVRRHLLLCLIIWFISGIGLEMVMYKLRIGVHTQRDLIDLPFKLNGAMVFYRDGFHILLLGYILGHADRPYRLKKRYLLLVLVEAVVASMTSLSKSALIFRLAPIVLFYMFERRLPVRKVFSVFLIVIPLFSLVIAGMTVLRGHNLSGQDISLLSEKAMTRFTPLSFIELVIKRVTGAPELMATVSYPEHSLNTLQDYLDGKINGTLEFYGLNLKGKMGAKGMTFWGRWFLSGSLFIVFLASAGLAMVVAFFEKLWQSKNLYFLSCFSSVLLATSFYSRAMTRAVYSVVMSIAFFVFLKLCQELRIVFLNKPAR